MHDAPNDPSVFLFHENWTRENDPKRHFETPHIKRWVELTKTLLAAPLELTNPVRFEFKNSAVRDVLTEYERAQSISFITRFDHLPQDYTMQIVEQQGAYFTGNMALIPHALNEFRELIQNEQDSVYYRKIHAVWYAMLVLDDPKKSTTIRVFDKTREFLPTG
jgi:hypothetical protein